MTLYRDMTTPQLAARALAWDEKSPHMRRLLWALAKRLEQEHERARQPRLGKPHIKLIHWPWYEARGMGSWQWVCLGPQGTRAYGSSPAKAYQAWANAMGRSVTAYRRKV